MKKPSVTPLAYTGKCRVRLASGGRVFVKFYVSQMSGARRRVKKGFEHEWTCLRVLAGLAVPERVVLPPRELRLLRLPTTVAPLMVATRYIDGRPLGHAGHEAWEIVACWLFVVEQLVAFRRRGVLYADIKCDNVIARRRPLRVSIIDFDGSTTVPSGTRYLNLTRHTLGAEAPEAAQAKRLTEASIVYELGMLLFHCLTGGNNQTLRSRPGALKPAVRSLKALGVSRLAELLEDCLRTDPSGRPKNFEAVLVRAQAIPLPTKIREAWLSLREPYRKRLDDLGPSRTLVRIRLALPHARALYFPYALR